MSVFIKDLVGKSKITKTEEGYMVVKDARIARTGIQEYFAAELPQHFGDREPSEIVRVYRPPEEVFSSDSMASFELQPVTNEHPEEGVDVKNYNGLSIGVASNIRRDGNFLIADLKITDPEAISDIESGKRELSNGYKSVIEVKRGKTPEGKVYDAIQRNIRGNHIAVVDAARCGPECSIKDKKRVPVMDEEVIIDGAPVKVPKAVAAEIKQLRIDNQTLTTQNASMQATHDAALASASKDSTQREQDLQAEVDSLKDNQITPEKIDVIVEERMGIIAIADKAIKGFSAKDKTCLAIKEVIQAHFGDAISANKLTDESYTAAMFDAAKATIEKTKDEDEEEENKDNKETETEKQMADSAKKTKHQETDMADSIKARNRRIVANGVASRFPIGVRNSGHPQHQAFNDAVNAEFKKKYGFDY